MNQPTVLIANRGEVALRVIRSVQDLGWKAVALYTRDDRESLHVSSADESFALPGKGSSGYLAMDDILEIASQSGADMLHPGWGFLSENPQFAGRCVDMGITYVGPTPEQLLLFGSKVAARDLAKSCGVPVLEASGILRDLQELTEFREQLGGDIIIKAAAGGGGRGMRPLGRGDNAAAVFANCRDEALKAFGDSSVYAERFLASARHIEIQVIGDAAGAVTHLWDRDCSIQRRYQKLIEIAPAPALDQSLRERLIEAALRMAGHSSYLGLGTFEFLVDGETDDFYFIEANPRLQVEHTVTEAITGFDLVALQLKIARGASLTELGVDKTPAFPMSMAIQLRINGERLLDDGNLLPTTGQLLDFEPGGGPGVRVDTAFRRGCHYNPAYDSLVAKLIVQQSGSDLNGLLSKARRALDEFLITGIDTNLSLLVAILAHPDVAQWSIDNRFVEIHLKSLLEKAAQHSKRLPPSERSDTLETSMQVPQGAVAVSAITTGAVIDVHVHPGEVIKRGDVLVTTEAMKMHYPVKAVQPGMVAELGCRVGDVVSAGQPLLYMIPAPGGDEDVPEPLNIHPDAPRGDLDELKNRLGHTRDENRPAAVAKRRKLGYRTARENIDDLLDTDSFMEYGALTIAAQRRRRDVDELMENTPADGLVAGFGTVNADQFGEQASRCAVLAYDYTVLAGTQGFFNHKKKNRLFSLIAQSRMPTVFYTEGGGGRPGDVDRDDLTMSWMDLETFSAWPRGSGIAPRIGINNGRCFAGNAIVFGLCDITIATSGSSIGLAGPAMIEGGGLGHFKAEEVGPMDVQTHNGVVDILCEDEQEATRTGKQVLGYFQGRLPEWTCEDQRLLRHLIPENRRHGYDIREIIHTLADHDSVVELRPEYGRGLITAFIRIEGRPYGLIANNTHHLGGALDNEGADTGSRFLSLCDTFGLPVISLCDTPGFMVGPESEKGAAVRRGSRFLLTCANLRVPLVFVVLRKAYGLGAQAMAGGSFKRPFLTASWPTGEFGSMGFEGAVKLGYSKELEAIADPQARDKRFQELVDEMYQKGKGVSLAQVLEVDTVIDPADTRQWIHKAICSAGTELEPRRNFPSVW